MLRHRPLERGTHVRREGRDRLCGVSKGIFQGRSQLILRLGGKLRRDVNNGLEAIRHHSLALHSSRGVAA